MIRYYCSGFDNINAFGHGMGDMLKDEIKDNNSLVCIPASSNTEKTIEKYIPLFTSEFKKFGIEFDKVVLLDSDYDKSESKKIVRNASIIILMGGDPFYQKELCEKLDIIDELKKYNGVMIGISAGAMLMSKYIIITPCSSEYPSFRIEEGMNLDNISIYPHNNTDKEEYPKEIVLDDEIYKKDDLIKVAKKYGNFYLLQDYYIEDGLVDISYIKSVNGIISFHYENNGKIWICNKDGITLLNGGIK